MTVRYGVPDDSFVDTVESMVDQLHEQAKDYVETMMNALMPDGRPFGMVKQTQKDQLRDYMKLRGSAQAWTDWLNQKVEQVITQAGNLPPDQVAQIAPYDIVYRFAINYSARMEDLLLAEQANHAAASSPPAPTQMVEIPEIEGPPS